MFAVKTVARNAISESNVKIAVSQKAQAQNVYHTIGVNLKLFVGRAAYVVGPRGRTS